MRDRRRDSAQKAWNVARRAQQDLEDLFGDAWCWGDECWVEEPRFQAARQHLLDAWHTLNDAIDQLDAILDEWRRKPQTGA
jgi:hypothetical protein